MMQRPLGWRKESYRHYLARKGIRTKMHQHKNVLKGGKGDRLHPWQVDQKELQKGIKVELEHTGNKTLAEDIAYDHLAEMPDYYTRLERMEKKKTYAAKKEYVIYDDDIDVISDVIDEVPKGLELGQRIAPNKLLITREEAEKRLNIARFGHDPEKLKHAAKQQHFAKKGWSDTTKDEDANSYIKRNVKSTSHGDRTKNFLNGVKKTAHTGKDLDEEWKEYTKLVDNERYGPYGHADKLAPKGSVERWNQRGAALFGRVVSQANVEPVVDHEKNRSFREVMMDIEFGRRA